MADAVVKILGLNCVQNEAGLRLAKSLLAAFGTSDLLPIQHYSESKTCKKHGCSVRLFINALVLNVLAFSVHYISRGSTPIMFCLKNSKAPPFIGCHSQEFLHQPLVVFTPKISFNISIYNHPRRFSIES